jgi:uncharacterized FlaG/YvyC family protein
MEYNDEIQKLEGEILELKDELRKTIDRELIYKEILTEIGESIDNQLKRDDENERFKFDDKINFKLFVQYMKEDLENYRRIYKRIDSKIDF